MAISNDVQKLEPGNTIRLIEVDGTKFGADILCFHNETIPHTPTEITASSGNEAQLPPKSIWWQVKEYGPHPYEIKGLEASSDGSGASPKLSVANLDSVITALCLKFDDMLQAKVTIHDTFVHYLDARNFPGGKPSNRWQLIQRTVLNLHQRKLRNDNRAGRNPGYHWQILRVIIYNYQLVISGW